MGCLLGGRGFRLDRCPDCIEAIRRGWNQGNATSTGWLDSSPYPVLDNETGFQPSQVFPDSYVPQSACAIIPTSEEVSGTFPFLRHWHFEDVGRSVRPVEADGGSHSDAVNDNCESGRIGRNRNCFRRLAVESGHAVDIAC